LRDDDSQLLEIPSYRQLIQETFPNNDQSLYEVGGHGQYMAPPEVVRNQEPKVNLLSESFFNMQDNKVIKSEPTENDLSDNDMESERLVRLAKSIEKEQSTHGMFESPMRNPPGMLQFNSVSSQPALSTRRECFDENDEFEFGP
jgi:hypothetical protein